jgi:hypothetical protein
VARRCWRRSPPAGLLPMAARWRPKIRNT